MFNAIKISLATLSLAMTSLAFASSPPTLEGTWQQIDDKTGSPKAIIEIRQENGAYVGKIVKVTPRPGYTPQKSCNKCPAPYTNQPILGMDVITGLKHVEGTSNYEKGRVIDPLAGKIYDARIRLNNNGKRLTLRGYMGVSALGRSQTWIRQE
jgi:uncharacterized protein (DUF2147 family)